MASIPADQFDGDQFDPEPHTQADYLRDIWHRVRRLEGKVTIQNGRVSKLERVAWASGGGLAVLAAIVVPIFINLVTR